MAAFFCSPQPRPNRLTAFLCPLHFSSLFLYPPSALFILTIIFIFALPAPACPARSLPHFTYTGFLLSPLRLHQPPKRFQTNIPPSTACLCLPSPAGLHIPAAPPLQKTPAPLRLATLDKTDKGNLPFFCRYVNEK